MDKLDTLSMNHNQLTRITAGDFEGLPRLTSLSLDYNKITFIDREAFRGLEGRTDHAGLMIDNDDLSCCQETSSSSPSLTTSLTSSPPERCTPCTS